MAAVACGSVGLGVSPCAGRKRDCGAAACWMLFDDEEIGGEAAFFDD